MKRFRLYLLVLLTTTASDYCLAQTSPLFREIPPGKSGLNFTNQVTETDSLNVFRYEYLYNGSGIGVGDFNQDGLEDLFFSGNQVPHKLFLNKGNLLFDDITSSAGVSGNGTWATGVTIADVNGDGLPDIYVCHSGKYSDSVQLRNELFINQGIKNGQPVFKEQAVEFGLDAAGTQSTHAAFLDYDLDGDLDMFLLNHSNHTYNPFLNTRKTRATPNMAFGNRLFRNMGNNRFEDVTLKSGIINHALNFGLSVTVSDLNGDGWPDLYTTSDYTEKDCLYINKRNGTFSEQVENSMGHISKYSMGADIADINNDGWTDIFTLDMLPEDNHRQKMLKGPDEYDQYHLLWDSGYFKQQMRNMLQLNRGVDQHGQLRFSEIGQLAGISNTDWSWSGLIADLDLDGWKDAFVTNGYLRDYTDMDFMKYAVAEARIEAAKQGHQVFQTHALVKKMPSNKLNNYLFKNVGGLRFRNVSADWGMNIPRISNAAIYADLDLDGDLDLVVVNNNDPVQLFENTARNQANPNNYLTVQLKGKGANSFAIGTRVELICSNGLRQLQELNPVRGYQSSQTSRLLFGIPTGEKIDTLKITWPDKSTTIQTTVALNRLHTVQQPQQENKKPASIPLPQKTWMQDITETARLKFRHKENEFIDFKDETLLPYMLSRMGPALATADVNGDGLEDVFIGTPIGQEAVLFLQRPNAKFELVPGPWSVDKESEDVQAVFFDADGDGDMDLYVSCGGNEYAPGSPEYQDRLYINDGKGGFEKSSALSVMTGSKQAIAVGDFDRDGDQDIWIGGYYKPGSFPMADRSYLLRNDSKPGRLNFTDITAEYSFLQSPGVITAASFTDTNGDGYPELILAGEWMNITIFQNVKGELSAGTVKLPEALSGWWKSITPVDLDGDGDLDFVLGNAGTNLQIRADKNEPVELFTTDLDNNGTLDPILTHYIHGKSYPIASRDELLEQVVPLRKKFVFYKDYANITLEGILSSSQRKKLHRLEVNNFHSGVLWNEGDQSWQFTALPDMAQVSSLQSVFVTDWNKDGKKDLFVGGNFECYRVQFGQSDASFGQLLENTGNRQFKVISPMETGVFLNGEVRQMKLLNGDSANPILIVASNNGPVQVIKINP